MNVFEKDSTGGDFFQESVVPCGGTRGNFGAEMFRIRVSNFITG